MGINITFFKTPKHRVYKYKPLYYDESKERINKLKADIEKEKADKDGEKYVNPNYVPGSDIRGSFREALEDNKRHSMKSSTNKILGLITLAILFAVLYFFAQNFQAFLTLIS